MKKSNNCNENPKFATDTNLLLPIIYIRHVERKRSNLDNSGFQGKKENKTQGWNNCMQIVKGILYSF